MNKTTALYKATAAFGALTLTLLATAKVLKNKPPAREETVEEVEGEIVE